MGHCTVAQQSDPQVDDIVGELAAVRVPLGACVVIGQEVREEMPREGGGLVAGELLPAADVPVKWLVLVLLVLRLAFRSTRALSFAVIGTTNLCVARLIRASNC